ncbi:MAG: hypothetical protein M3Y57_03760 [Acidobacteriota bacterium]|nr:hypothetical protein [Acidobacteriota bacterium]
MGRYPAPPREPEKHHPAPSPCEHERDRDCGHECREEDRPSKVIERTWYYGREEEEPECRVHTHDPCRDDDRDRPCDDDHGHGHHGRPTRPPGVSTGRLGDDTPLTPADINAPNIPGVWVGPRADMDLPYLFLRANPADLGTRPVKGAPFWESPDIFILAGVTPALAPPLPHELGQQALAGQPNTIYAHVWNFGKAAANEVVVEFYWVDPSLGINPGSVHLIAQTFASLGAKGSGRSHAVVKCPEAWTPTFVNGGHECLLVRAWDNPSDLPGEPKFDASINRHVGQRNIHVAPPGAHLFAAMTGGTAAPAPPGPALANPLLLKVGPLYGAPAQVAVERVSPNSVPWLQLHTGKRGVFPAMAAPTGAPTLSAPTTAGGGFPATAGAAQQHVRGDDQHVALSTSDDPPGPGEAHVYRVSATQAGALFGGYTVIILG